VAGTQIFGCSEIEVKKQMIQTNDEIGENKFV